MKNNFATIIPILFVIFSLAVGGGCSKDDANSPDNKAIVISATGDINPALEEFRGLLGGQLNTTPGAVGGRREINWDGLPEELLNTKLPEDFFNPTGPIAPIANQRGLRYSPGGNFQVSKSGFAEINPGAADQFASFSGNKSFANISSNLWEVGFEVPGQAIAASVHGFGIVFSDVDLPQSTSLEFFDGDKSLGKFFAPAKEGSNFSFLGVYFKEEKVTHVRVTHEGRLDLGVNDVSHNGPSDLVIMDDFLYSEPVKQ